MKTPLDRIREARAKAPKKTRPRRTKATAMKKDPKDRPASAKELADRLDALEFTEKWESSDAERWWHIHRS